MQGWQVRRACAAALVRYHGSEMNAPESSPRQSVMNSDVTSNAQCMLEGSDQILWIVGLDAWIQLYSALYAIGRQVVDHCKWQKDRGGQAVLWRDSHLGYLCYVCVCGV